MNSLFNKRITLFKNQPNRNLLCCNLRGIEREALRVDSSGNIAKTPHPLSFGSALTHPSITTDYSESLLEFITEPYPKINSVLTQLTETHQYTLANLPEGESLWPSSMPCILGKDEDIPVAQYGSSNVGLMKTIYRRGLGHRYGRKMQTIAGLHFNFSVPDAVWCQMRTDDKSLLSLQEYRTTGYMGLVRNFRRRFWLLLYLMGASPAVDKSFVAGRTHDLDFFNDRDLYLPYATSLRMGDLGYQSTAQDDLYVCYNSVKTYVASLREALLKEYPGYQTITAASGAANQTPALQQLSSSVLQIENEFYSTIRPKQTAKSGETQLRALTRRGIEYIEVRCTDINPYEPIGINQQQIEFLELFLLGCLFDDSPETAEGEYQEVLANQRLVVREGRKPDLMLHNNGSPISMNNWGTELMQKLEPIAKILDELNGHQNYSDSLVEMQNLLENPDKTPSAKILEELKLSGQSFVDWSLKKSTEHRNTLLNETLSPEKIADFQKIAAQSHSDQEAIENVETENLENYINSYFKQYHKL